MVFGPNIRLDLKTDKQVYIPGDRVVVYLNMYTNKAFKFKEAYMELICFAKLHLIGPVVSEREDGALVQKKHRTEIIELLRIAEPLRIAGNVIQPPAMSFTWTAQLPEDALPTHDGDVIKINWVAKISFKRKYIGDLYRSNPIYVLLHIEDELLRKPATKKEILDFGIAIIRLQKAMYLPNEQIQGEVEFAAVRDVKIREIMAFLTHEEEIAPIKLGRSKYVGKSVRVFAKQKLSKKIKMNLGDTIRLPFAFNIPYIQRPTILTKKLISLWNVHIKIPRRIISDIDIKIPVIVANSYEHKKTTTDHSPSQESIVA